MSLWILNDKNEISITKARLQLSWVYRVWVAVIILLFFIPTRRTDSVKCPGWRTIQLSQLRWALPLSSVDSLDPLCSSWAHLKLVLGHLYLAVAGSRWPIWWTRLVLLFFWKWRVNLIEHTSYSRYLVAEWLYQSGPSNMDCAFIWFSNVDESVVYLFLDTQIIIVLQL